MEQKNIITWKFKSILIVGLTVFIAFMCRVLGVSNALPQAWNRPLGIIRSLLYIGLFFAWGITLRKRVVQPNIQKQLLTIDVLIIFWLILRTLKYFFIDVYAVNRYIWYLYYVPILFIPMYGVSIAFALDKPISDKYPKFIYLMQYVTTALFLLVMTNDLHQKVFVFLSGEGFYEWNDFSYGYSVVSYIIVVWRFFCSFLTFAVLIKKYRILKNRNIIMALTIAPCIFTVLYAIGYWKKAGLLLLLFGDLTVAQSLLYASFFEVCIEYGIIGSNTRYAELFKVLEGCSAQITDCNYNICYSALDAVCFNIDDLINSEEKTLRLENDLILHNMPINGGHVIWTDDVSEYVKLNETLEETKEELEERNSLLSYEYKREKLRRETEEENFLYDMLKRVTQKQTDKIGILVKEYKSVDNMSDNAKNILAHIAVLCCYIKRRKHLELLKYRNYNIAVSEIESAFNETMRILKLLSVRSTVFINVGDLIDADTALTVYEFFENCIENKLLSLEAVNVRFTELEGKMRVTVSLESKEKQDELSEIYPQATIENIDNEWLIMMQLNR